MEEASKNYVSRGYLSREEEEDNYNEWFANNYNDGWSGDDVTRRIRRDQQQRQEQQAIYNEFNDYGKKIRQEIEAKREYYKPEFEVYKTFGGYITLDGIMLYESSQPYNYFSIDKTLHFNYSESYYPIIDRSAIISYDSNQNELIDRGFGHWYKYTYDLNGNQLTSQSSDEAPVRFRYHASGYRIM